MAVSIGTMGITQKEFELDACASPRLLAWLVHPGVRTVGYAVLTHDRAVTSRGRHMISLYVHPTCTSCRKAVALLDQLDAEVERRDYFRDRFTPQELSEVLARAGRTPAEMLSTRARAYREPGFAERTVTDDELIALMVGEPTLLRRPLAIANGQSTVGFNVAALTALAATDAAG